MQFVTEQLRLLGLNDREIRVFVALTTFGPLSMTAIAGRSGVSRTTVDYIVRSLMRQGIVATAKVGARNVYSIAPQDIADKLDALERKFRPKEKTYTQDDEKIVAGEHHTLEKLLAEHAGERIQVHWGNAFTSPQRMEQLRSVLQALKSVDVYVQMVVTKDLGAFMCAHAAALMPYVPEWKWRASIVPTTFGLEADLIVFRDEALVLGPKGEHVGARGTVEALKSLVRNTFEIGRQVDLLEYLRGECRC